MGFEPEKPLPETSGDPGSLGRDVGWPADGRSPSAPADGMARKLLTRAADHDRTLTDDDRLGRLLVDLQKTVTLPRASHGHSQGLPVPSSVTCFVQSAGGRAGVVAGTDPRLR